MLGLSTSRSPSGLGAAFCRLSSCLWRHSGACYLLACISREHLGCLLDVDAGGELGAMGADGTHAWRRLLPGTQRWTVASGGI